MSNLCENVEELGITRNGAMAEYVSVPCKTLHKIPSNISFKEAALIEPTAVTLHGVNRIFEHNKKSLENQSVLIFGDGPIGLLCLQAAKIRNPSQVYIVGKSQKKLEVAEKLGCNGAINTFGCSEGEAISFRTYAFETLFSISVGVFCIVYSILTNIRYAGTDYLHSNA